MESVAQKATGWGAMQPAGHHLDNPDLDDEK